MRATNTFRALCLGAALGLTGCVTVHHDRGYDDGGRYGDYVTATVEAENADRTALMRAMAADRRRPLAEIEAEQAKLWRERAFPGEWIEVQAADGTWQWTQQRADDASSQSTVVPAPAPAPPP